MDVEKIHDLARRLLRAYGPSAMAEARRKAVCCELDCDEEQADIWRRIGAALKDVQRQWLH